ncbi:hypothetical protein IT568_01665 [bacterium]|nr:hypothetical protein [bacterium]
MRKLFFYIVVVLLVSCSGEKIDYFPFEKINYFRLKSFETINSKDFSTFTKTQNDLVLQVKKVQGEIFRIDFEIERETPFQSPLIYFKKNENSIFFTTESYFTNELVYTLPLILPIDFKCFIEPFEIVLLGIEDLKLPKKELSNCGVFELKANFTTFRVWLASGKGIVKVEQTFPNKNTKKVWILSDFVNP